MSFGFFEEKTQINWNDIVNTPVSFPSVWEDISDKPSTFPPETHLHPEYALTGHTHTFNWDDIANKPATYPPATHTHNYEPAFSKNTAFNKNFGTTAGTVCQGNDTRLNWTPHYYNNSNYPDLVSLISGTGSGTIVNAISNRHYVIGLQNNDGSDSFCVVGTDFSLSDNQPYTQLYFRCGHGLFQYKNNDIWHDGNIDDKLGVASFESDGIRITNSFGADTKIKPIFVSEGAYTLLDIEIDNQTKIRASTWSIELYTQLLARDIRGEDISCDGLRITNCPTYSSSLPRGAVYKDANGFLKIK
ncbi:hypothetical protein [Vibrio sp.]|uniref:hypothetical protein n=1 Tax=Vibrio sp. TaxID=678 RepID=UPI003D0F5384